MDKKPSIEIYTKDYCGFCRKALALLGKKDVSFVQHRLEDDPKLSSQMEQRAKGASTVPQIFINDAHIGGCDELHALDRNGELDELLKTEQ